MVMKSDMNVHHSNVISFDPQFILAMPFIFLSILYCVAVFRSNRNLKHWPIYRTIYLAIGVFLAVISVWGPFAEKAHSNFILHMIGHLFLGMLSPLLIALAAPMSLLLRTLNVRTARKVSRLLRSWPIKVYTHPVIASILNIGGLWLLYTTNLYSLIHENLYLHILIHFHVFAAGYLFTVSMIYIDPVYHRYSFILRATVFICALAGHQILSKYIYANPPIGVSAREAEIGGMIMYYGGDAVDILLIVILCWQWYRATRPRGVLTVEGRTSLNTK